MEITNKMRKRLILASCLALVASGFVALAVAWLRPPQKVSLVLTGYKRCPGGNIYAELRLVNNTSNIVTYTLMREGGETAPVISRAYSSTGWTSGHWEAYAIGKMALECKLYPGKSADFVVPLTPDAPPKQMAVLCGNLPRMRPAFSNRLRDWAVFYCSLLKIKFKNPARFEWEDGQIWCEEVIDPTKASSEVSWNAGVEVKGGSDSEYSHAGGHIDWPEGVLAPGQGVVTNMIVPALTGSVWRAEIDYRPTVTNGWPKLKTYKDEWH